MDSSPDNDGTNQHRQMVRARQARQKAYARNQRLNAPQETHQPNLADMGWAAARNPIAANATGRTPTLVNVAGREATVKSAA